MNHTKPEMIMHRWNVIQHELIPAMREQVGTLTPKLERLIHTLEWVCIEEFMPIRLTQVDWCFLIFGALAPYCICPGKSGP